MTGLGRRQRETRNEMIAAMERFEWDMHDAVAQAGRIPDEWRAIWEARGAPKERITLRIDRDVLRFYRSMGAGFGPRMNAVLRSFMQARLAGLIEHGDLAERYREDWMGKPRPTPAAAKKEGEALMRDMLRTNELLAKIAAAPDGRPGLTPSEFAELKMLGERFSAMG